MGKQANLLIFYLHLEILNDVLTRMVKGVRTLPEDLQIFKIGERESYLGGYYLMMASNTFPLVNEGERCKEGVIEFNRGVLTWMKQK